ncbi:MAG TPA: helix-turn-helix domain-containing protein [Nocardioidaceae bacterium]|nr:helix-turn-helix domain-containing protein [Nocardioidaceae bacterium]
MSESKPLDQITPTPVALRALAHPVRLRLLGLLRVDGPSTATKLAERLGLNSGATSYHLRQLAQHDFVVEDAERGNSRDRWWRAAHRSTQWRDDTPDAAARDATDAFVQAAAVVYTEQLQRAMEERPMLSREWRRATTNSDWVLDLTPERGADLKRRLVAVIEEYADDEPADGSAQVMLQLHVFPRPGTVAGADA